MRLTPLLVTAILGCANTGDDLPLSSAESADSKDTAESPAQLASLALMIGGDQEHTSGQTIHLFLGLDAAQVKEVLTTGTNAGIEHMFWHVSGSRPDFTAIPLATPVPLSETNLTFGINMRLPRFENMPVRYRYMEFGKEQAELRVTVEEASFVEHGVLRMSWSGKLHFEVPDAPGVDMYFTQSNYADAAIALEGPQGGAP